MADGERVYDGDAGRAGRRTGRRAAGHRCVRVLSRGREPCVTGRVCCCYFRLRTHSLTKIQFAHRTGSLFSVCLARKPCVTGRVRRWPAIVQIMFFPGFVLTGIEAHGTICIIIHDVLMAHRTLTTADREKRPRLQAVFSKEQAEVSCRSIIRERPFIRRLAGYGVRAVILSRVPVAA